MPDFTDAQRAEKLHRAIGLAQSLAGWPDGVRDVAGEIVSLLEALAAAPREDGSQYCGDTNGPYRCTRLRGHEGSHDATWGGAALHRWDDAGLPAPPPPGGDEGLRDWKWRGMPGHLIVASKCCFHMVTDIGEHRVSTIGCYHQEGNGEGPLHEIGAGRLYETMVFALAGDEIVPSELEAEGYMTEAEAEAGHMAMCRKWAAASPVASREPRIDFNRAWTAAAERGLVDEYAEDLDGEEDRLKGFLGDLAAPEMEEDPCTCSDPSCPRRRGFVRDGKGAWRRARPVASREDEGEWTEEVVEVTPGAFPDNPYVDAELAAAIAVSILQQANVDVSAMAQSGRIPDWEGEKLARRVTAWRPVERNEDE